MTLGESQTDGEQNVCAEEQGNHGPSPQHAADLGQKFVGFFHKF
jgi:hypothetical protein